MRKTRNHRPEFDVTADFVALSDLKINGVAVTAGEGIDKSAIDPRRLEQMYRALQIGYAVGKVPKAKKLPRVAAVGPTDIMMDMARVLDEQAAAGPQSPPPSKPAVLRRGLARAESRRAQ